VNTMVIPAGIAELEDEMIALRRRIHAHPELAYEEHVTGDLVAEHRDRRCAPVPPERPLPQQHRHHVSAGSPSGTPPPLENGHRPSSSPQCTNTRRLVASPFTFAGVIWFRPEKRVAA